MSASNQESTSNTDNFLISGKNAVPAPKHKRRRRGYDRSRSNDGFTQQLETVFEGEEMRLKKSWRGSKFFCYFFTLFVCIASIIHVNGGTKLIIGRTINSDDDIYSEDEEESYDGISMPEQLRHLAEVNEPIMPTDRAFLWHIPRSGGTTIEEIVLQCFSLVLASDRGAAAQSNNLDILTDMDGQKFVNVDTSSFHGIQHAKNLNIADFAELGMIKSSLFYDAAENLFSNDHQGRCFTLIRHPVERVVSLFYYRKKIMNLPGKIETYADQLDPNWMTRMLSNASENEELTEEHLIQAKYVLQRKCLIGLLSIKSEAMMRFEAYFQWILDEERASDCQGKLLHWDWPIINKYDALKEGSDSWRALAQANEFDMKLYHHAERVYKRQGRNY